MKRCKGGWGTKICGAVLVVDDDVGTRGVLADILGRAGFVVREAADGERALQLVDEQTPDVVILDVGIPGVSSFVLCRLLRLKFGERLPIILVSADRVEPFDRTAGLLLGADDYIVKPFDSGELLARVQRFVSRTSWDGVRRTGATEAEDIQGFDLTRRETEILELLVRGLNQGQIAHELVISPNTVATHIQRILIKLGVHTRAQAIAFAAREGLVASTTQPAAPRATNGNEDRKHRESA
jgi:DNA-binding NarL/FixJ family response regulator